jgi:GNAT superfamily N-acetyltransferase
VTIAEHPDLLEAAYPLARDEGYTDLALEGSISIPLDEWLHDEATLPAGSFIALADGEIVGYAGVERDEDVPRRAGHSVTVVRRDWRRRGVASALKQETIAWASVSGVRELYTWTQDVNAGMRRVNERLGYVPRGLGIFLRAELPLSR